MPADAETLRETLREKYETTTLSGLCLMHEDDTLEVVLKALRHRPELMHRTFNAICVEYAETNDAFFSKT